MISRHPTAIVFASLLCFGPVGWSSDMVIGQSSNLKDVVKQVSAGDVLILENGTWQDCKILFDQLRGTANAPITIRAQTPGQVIFTGDSQLSFSGQHVVVTGFVFRDTHCDNVLQARTHSQRHAHWCRVTDCDFQQSADNATKNSVKIESHWLSLYGTNNRVDHCRFVGKRSPGTTLVVWVDEQANHHQIDHNYFGPRPELGKNGGETIRIGTSEVCHLESKTLVVDNFFDRCNGESEIVSNKSCGNTYRHNVFSQCSGTLTLRHGHRCLVDGNVFLGDEQSGTGGVRIIGSGHVVTNNYFSHLRGNELRAAICMMNAPPNDAANGYSPVRDAVVSHNTFVDCKSTMEIGVEASEKQNVAPADCVISHNLFSTGKWPLLKFYASPTHFEWNDNVRDASDKLDETEIDIRRTEIDLKKGNDDILRPNTTSGIQATGSTLQTDIDGGKRSTKTLVGCDDPATPARTWVTQSSTGPSWSK